MESISFGEVLRQTRERKGLDLNATARRLRIRPDILRAIEDSNFAAMPPRGYTRNMVNGYARYLGLNPTEITGMYLDELYAYQVDYASSRRRSSGIDMSEAPDNDFTGRFNTRRNQATGGVDRGTGSIDRVGGRTRPARSSALPNTEYTNFYSGPNVESGLREKLPFLIAAAIGLLLVIILGTRLFGCSKDNESQEVPNVPVTGVSSETGQSSSEVTVEKAPTKFTFEYDLDSGVESWIEVYVDGESKVSESQTGPVKKSFDSSGTLQFICANPSGVTVKIDGVEQKVEADADGMVNMTISFADILAKWIAEHPNSAEAKAQAKQNASSNQSASGTNTSSNNAVGSNAATNVAQETQQSQESYTEETYDESYDQSYDENYYDESNYNQEESYNDYSEQG